MTIIRVIDNQDRNERLCIEGDFRESDVVESLQELKEKLQNETTVEDLAKLLQEKGFTFKQVWIHTLEI